MTEYTIHVASVSNLFGVYKVEYQSIPFRTSMIKGYIYLTTLVADRIPFRSLPYPRIPRTNLMGEIELPTFNLLVNSSHITSGCYTPETRRIILYLPQPPNLLYHWLVISGDAAKVPWMKEGF